MRCPVGSEGNFRSEHDSEHDSEHRGYGSRAGCTSRGFDRFLLAVRTATIPLAASGAFLGRMLLAAASAAIGALGRLRAKRGRPRGSPQLLLLPLAQLLRHDLPARLPLRLTPLGGPMHKHGIDAAETNHLQHGHVRVHLERLPRALVDQPEHRR